MRTWLHRFLSLSLLIALGISQAAPVNALAFPQPSQKAAVEVEIKLQQQFQENGSAGYLIYFREKADLSPAYSMGWDERGQFVMQTLQDVAQRSQQDVREMLDKDGVKYQSFWIDNIILVEDSDVKTFQALQNRLEIESLKARRTMYVMDDATAATMDVEAPANSPEAVEPNLVHVNADDVWAMGINGAGVVVSTIDTGVRYTHHALNSQYRGNLGSGDYEHNYNWFDPYGVYNYPFDDHGQGSQNMGILVGDDGGVNQIGMAPGAEWMACRACISIYDCPDTALLECAQFITAPFDLNHANPDPSKRPNVVNNSWGDCGQSYDNWYQGSVDAWHAAGIYPVFTTKNNFDCNYSLPPPLNTVGNPARYGNVTGVGSTGTSNGQYANRSNWGPTDNPDTINPRGYPHLKPQVVAPGIQIRTANNDNDAAYYSLTSTSMAASHVAGLVALVMQAAPCLVGQYARVETLIEETVVPVPYATGGTPPPGPGNVPNYATGWGEIDALAAVNAALNTCGDSHIIGTVTSAGAPIEGAKVEATDGTHTESTYTAAGGVYSLLVFGGTQDVTASAYGYLPETITGAVVPAGETVIQDFDLDPATAFAVNGVVTDANTGWPLYARIAIDGYPQGSIFTDPLTGAYSVVLAAGMAYTFNVQAVVPGYLADSAVVGPLSADEEQSFNLMINRSTCTAPGYHSVGGVVESFGSGTLPAGWTVIDHTGNGSWTFNSYRNNNTGGSGGFAIVDSDDYGLVFIDAELRTPVWDMSAETSVVLEFKHDFKDWTGETGRVDVSIDGGASWINQITFSNADYRGTIFIDVSSIAAGEPEVMFRWSYFNAYNSWWWQVDDVKYDAECLPMEGGLVFGNVIDENILEPLVGAKVGVNTGQSTTTFATPDDPAQEDGLYFLFSPIGDHTFTASYSGFRNEVVPLNIQAGSVLKQDFSLGAGYLVVAPASLETSLLPGQTEQQILTLRNLGSSAIQWRLKEFDDGIISKDRSFLSEDHLIFENFEGDLMPPAGWVQYIYYGPETWRFDKDYPFSGEQYAAVNYDTSLQNEWLLTPEFVLQEGTLSFWSFGSVIWCLYEYDNCDLNVWIVVGAPGGGDDVFVGLADDDWLDYWYGQSVFDLTPLLPGGPVRIGFQYYGNDGAKVGIDVVVLDGLDGVDHPWINAVDPTTGTLGAGGVQEISVTFDADAVSDLGDYLAEFRISENTPYIVENIPVIMHVVETFKIFLPAVRN